MNSRTRLSGETLPVRSVSDPYSFYTDPAPVLFFILPTNGLDHAHDRGLDHADEHGLVCGQDIVVKINGQFNSSQQTVIKNI